jgi:hypothetical protein
LFDEGDGIALLFVSNALDGTVSRLTLTVETGGVTVIDAKQIADPAHRSEIIEFTPEDEFVAAFDVASGQTGAFDPASD